MPNGVYRVPRPVNEPVKNYAPGSPERASIRARLTAMQAEVMEIPCIVGGREIYTGKVLEQRLPHDHRHVLARCHQATPKEVKAAVAAAREAWQAWSRMPWESRAAIFLKAADLLAGPFRDEANAATMLGQSKTVHQAEIDSACELIDFWRFNCQYMQDIYEEQPASAPGTWNVLEHRPLEGFIFAITPFNFSSIGGNLPTAPAIMGNTCIWKPARTATASAYVTYKILEAAGLPPGVINFLPGPGSVLGPALLESPDLAGVHFTGSTAVFQDIWSTIGTHIKSYRGYPRIVGETGGKDFVFAHATADPLEVATALVRGAFEYQGQKCSAASRAFIPRSLWPAVKRAMKEQLREVKMGDITDFSNFMGAVIDEGSFEKLSRAIASARRSSAASFVWGGGFDKKTGYFIEPTVIEFSDPRHRIMREELFGPVLGVHVYGDRELDTALELCDAGSPYALTGAVFARDRQAIMAIMQKLRHTAGNFYINDKPTGAVVGQQPFGGSRASGTNDKAGSPLNLLRWVTPRAIKETFVPARHFSYPFLAADEI